MSPLSLLLLLCAVVVAYLIGSIPLGWGWVKLLTGQDVRKVGSGRTGGTNAARAGGRLAGVLTGVADFFKGALGVWLAQMLVPPAQYGVLAYWAQAAAGSAAIAGHNWSIYLGFKGGAGTGPNLGVSFAFTPLSLLLVPLVPLLLYVTGYASVASLVIAALVPVLFLLLCLIVHWPWAYVVYGLIAMVLVSLSLRPNIQRLLSGNERMVGPRAKRKAQEQTRS